MSKLSSFRHHRWTVAFLLSVAPLAFASEGNPTFMEALNINPITLFFVAFYYLICIICLGVFIYKRHKAKNSYRRWTITLVVILGILPWAEEFWLAWRFSSLCKEAGTHMQQQIYTDGYFNSTTSGWDKPETITEPSIITGYEEQGFQFQERYTSTNPYNKNYKKFISHVEKYPDGSWRVTVLNKPMARYEYRYAPKDSRPRLYKIAHRETQILDRQTGEIVAWEIQYVRAPSWVNGWTKWISDDTSSRCIGPPFPRSLPYSAFVPKDTNITN